MRYKFVTTSNVLAFREAFEKLQNRGAQECTLIVLDGKPGLGKTTTLQHWVAQTNSIYLCANPEWRPNWALKELLKSLGQEHIPHAYEKRYEAVIEALEHRKFHDAAGHFSLVIDEADQICGNGKLMETFRALSNLLGVPVIFVGMGQIRNRLKRYPQIASRVSKYVTFGPANKEDVRRLFDELCEVPVADDIITFVLKVSQGYNREIMEAIALVEGLGRLNASNEAMTLADIAGEVILHDRNTSKEIRVPEGVA